MSGQYKKIFQIANILAVIFTILINMLAVILPINGKTTQELSDNLPNLFVPAGLTFSIWGIIYILLIVFSLYQARDLFSKEQIEMPSLEKIRFLFLVSSMANILWIFLWHYQYVEYSLVIMVLLLISLLAIYRRLDIGKTIVSKGEKWCVHVPFSVYLGWISVATVANVTAVLVTVGWNGFGVSEQNWTILIIFVILILTLLMLILRKDLAYALVIMWALLGIVIKRLGNDPFYGVQTTIAYVAATTLVIVGVCVLVLLVMSVFKKQNTVKTV